MGFIYLFEGARNDTLSDPQVGMGLAGQRGPKALILEGRSLFSVSFRKHETGACLKVWDMQTLQPVQRLMIVEPFGYATWDPWAKGLWISSNSSASLYRSK